MPVQFRPVDSCNIFFISVFKGNSLFLYRALKSKQIGTLYTKCKNAVTRPDSAIHRTWEFIKRIKEKSKKNKKLSWLPEIIRYILIECSNHGIKHNVSCSTFFRPLESLHHRLPVFPSCTHPARCFARRFLMLSFRFPARPYNTEMSIWNCENAIMPSFSRYCIAFHPKGLIPYNGIFAISDRHQYAIFLSTSGFCRCWSGAAHGRNSRRAGSAYERRTAKGGGFMNCNNSDRT